MRCLRYMNDRSDFMGIELVFGFSMNIDVYLILWLAKHFRYKVRV